jgi:hypothetical protein
MLDMILSFQNLGPVIVILYVDQNHQIIGIFEG